MPTCVATLFLDFWDFWKFSEIAEMREFGFCLCWVLTCFYVFFHDSYDSYEVYELLELKGCKQWKMFTIVFFCWFFLIESVWTLFIDFLGRSDSIFVLLCFGCLCLELGPRSITIYFPRKAIYDRQTTFMTCVWVCICFCICICAGRCITYGYTNLSLCIQCFVIVYDFE